MSPREPISLPPRTTRSDLPSPDLLFTSSTLKLSVIIVISLFSFSEAEAEAYQGDEEAIIEKLLQKKGYDREAADPKEKAKISRFLLSKGFSYDSFSDMI